MRVKTHKCNNIHEEQQNNVQLLLPRFDGTVKAGYKKDAIFFFFLIKQQAVKVLRERNTSTITGNCNVSV